MVGDTLINIGTQRFERGTPFRIGVPFPPKTARGRVNYNMSDTNGDDENGTVAAELTPERAYDLYDNKGHSYREIAGMYDTSHTTVRRRVETYKSGMESGVEEVTSNPEEYELTELSDDEESDENPFETTCPACGNMIETPDSAGENPCPECGKTLNWAESEI